MFAEAEVVEEKVKYRKLSSKFLNKNDYTLHVANVEIRLTGSEFILLETLFNAENMFCTYEQLSRKIYEYNHNYYTDRGLKTILMRLRKKLGKYLIINTVRGRGLKIERIVGYDRG